MSGELSLDPGLVAKRVDLLEQLHAQVADAHGQVDTAYAITGPERLVRFEETVHFTEKYQTVLLNLEGHVSALARRIAQAAQNLHDTAAAAQRVDDEVAERLLRVIREASALAEGAHQSYLARGGTPGNVIAV